MVCDLFQWGIEGAGAADPVRGAALGTFAVVGVGALGCWVGGLLGDRWGRTRLTTLAMALSGACALALAGLAHAGPGAVLVISLLWGFWIIADSAQFSAIVSEIAPPAYVGTALTAQLALGFTLTAGSIALVPALVYLGAGRWSSPCSPLAHCWAPWPCAVWRAHPTRPALPGAAAEQGALPSLAPRGLPVFRVGASGGVASLPFRHSRPSPLGP
ncbi:hypothetical protein [Deinococcus multiflagellatus]|uniref:Major facilitator superfamily (MFS) profile domain-containing protein n=1 Tax=Deinococcus multiflagellatus TaxID=1656887 RepID=A0ABW1ZV25_9DEIO